MNISGYRTRALPGTSFFTLLVSHGWIVALACTWPVYLAWAPLWLFFSGGGLVIVLMTVWMLRLRRHHPHRVWGHGTHQDTSATWTDVEGTWSGLVVQWKPEPPWMHWILRLGFFPLATAWTLWRAFAVVPWHLLAFWRPNLLIILGLMQWANPITLGTATLRTPDDHRLLLHLTHLTDALSGPSDPPS